MNLEKATEVLRELLPESKCDCPTCKDIQRPVDEAINYFISLAEKLEEGKIAGTIKQWEGKQSFKINYNSLSKAILSYLTEEKK